MKRILIRGARAPIDNKLISNVSVLIEDGKIIEVGSDIDAQDAEIYDAEGKFLLPAFIDLHVHGGGGFDFADGTQEAFDGVMRAHLSHGVTLLSPTLVSDSFENTLKFLSMCKELGEDNPMFCGAHLEGPFLSPEMCGAQNLSHIIKPREEHIEALASYSDVISTITAAPEIEGVCELAKKLSELGVRMSIGHSNANIFDIEKALECGFSRVTHLYSATSRRSKIGSYVVGGIEECALTDDRFTVELIADGHHVCKESLLLTKKCKGEENIILVSDAMRAAGQDNLSESYLGKILPENRVIIEDGVAKLPDRSSFAGSIGIGDTMLAALVGRYGVPIETISYMMSASPAKVLGIKRGEIKCGYDAELIILDENYKTVKIFSEAMRYYKCQI